MVFACTDQSLYIWAPRRARRPLLRRRPHRRHHPEPPRGAQRGGSRDGARPRGRGRPPRGRPRRLGRRALRRHRRPGAPRLLRGRRSQGHPRDRFGRRARHQRGGFGGFVYRERTKPIVVAVDGLATAGGLEIVLAADVVVATTRSSFGLAEVRRNLIAAAGGLFRLPRAIGAPRRWTTILTGEPIDASRAYELGLVSRLVEPGAADDEAIRVRAADRRPRRRSRCGPAGGVVLAAERDDDDTCARSPGRCSTSCSRRRTPRKAWPPSPRSARPSGRGAEVGDEVRSGPMARTRRPTIPTQREVAGPSRRDHRHLGDRLRPPRLPRHRHRRAVRGQRLRQGRLLLLHRVEGGAPRRHPRPRDGRGDARRATGSPRPAGHRRRSSRCSARSCST